MRGDGRGRKKSAEGIVCQATNDRRPEHKEEGKEPYLLMTKVYDLVEETQTV